MKIDKENVRYFPLSLERDEERLRVERHLDTGTYSVESTIPLTDEERAAFALVGAVLDRFFGGTAA